MCSFVQLFTEYGRLACDGDGKAFQTLTFLVRDWMSDYEHSHGFAGGKELLDRRLEVRSLHWFTYRNLFTSNFSFTDFD